ncbi:TIGR03084 family metal-binding protein [Saccharopolyspora mangrovi]|uniref:TIGR03084 family metal-binding protein n=1 Tax=Saccharopolyspora mangrovi TaxID=3082379 RepID=A0ABU6AEN7_9PSEU|nr:TIGR03084 family metal-binding protein [Saccharopolyspora sp. S2-29]MEB3370014.1 TIGR03084 family metal-binding protein [Saccharopolyspora sp. S2-29]
MSKLDEVLADLEVEGDQLESLVAGLTDQQWLAPTPAEGWTIGHQIAHLAWTDEAAVMAATDQQGWNELVLRADGDLNALVDAGASTGAKTSRIELLTRWHTTRTLLAKTLRAQSEGQRLPWFDQPMSLTSMATARFMETWAHGLDVAQAMGLASKPTDRVRHVVHLGVRARSFAFNTNGFAAPEDDVFVSLRLPSGEVWEHGSPRADNAVRGSAYDFSLRVTQRRHRSDLDLVATGPVADKWLDIAQAFAGPPGKGRPPSS